MSELNKPLYKQLEGVFGEVRIANEGEQFIAIPLTGADGRTYHKKIEGGEEYRVCCPICGDTRFRLYINHMWGRDLGARVPTSRLVKCFNEDCDVREFLESKLNSSALESVNDAPEVVLATESRELIKPLPFPDSDWCDKLTGMVSTAAPVEYLTRRNFDIKYLEDNYGVTYAREYPVERNGKSYSWLGNRLFIPTEGNGWQARDLSGTSSMKYVSCPGWKKSRSIYNLQPTRAKRFCIVTEGVTDAWRLKDHGVAIYGKSISRHQAALLAENFGVVGVALDKDAYELDASSRSSVSSGDKTISLIASGVPVVFKVPLIGDKDPADHTETELWKCVYAGATKMNVNLVRESENV